MSRMSDVEETLRTFETAWFAKAARKARISDENYARRSRKW
jgi:hypothetical protein